MKTSFYIDELVITANSNLPVKAVKKATALSYIHFI